jgi:peptide/nickel transport system substrate-binding protein
LAHKNPTDFADCRQARPNAAAAVAPMTPSKLFSMVPPMALRLIRQGFAALAGLVLLAGVKGVSAEEAAPPTYAIAMHGAPALGPAFDHLPYANPDAPKGGRLNLAFLGTFDSLNPYNVKALSTAQGLNGNVYQSLMFRSADEPFTLYGLIAQSIETDAAREHVTFRLNPKAQFSDGDAITSADVAFTFELLRKKGRPQQRAAYGAVKGIETPDALTVRYDLAGANDRELPLALAMMPVLSKAHTDAEHFEDQTLQLPVGSGPYVVAEVRAGQRLLLKRNPNYWGRDLPIMRGLFNFDEVDIDYYRDAPALFEAFKAGLYDFRIETDPTLWLTGYDFPALREGRIIKQSIPIRLPKGMDGFAFNTRRAIFSDPRVREALGMMFDFEWINREFYAGVYARAKSYFDDSELSASGHPASEKERALLAPFPGIVRDDVMDGAWAPPVSNGSGRDRDIARKALEELGSAGYTIKNGALVNAAGARLAFEILVKNRQEERLADTFAQNLARIGVAANVRLIDEVQFQRRRTDFNFDMIEGSWIATPSPGAEQLTRWGSISANMQGAYNICGVASPAVDAMIAAMLAAESHEDFVAAVRALDRVLISGFYIVPLFYAPNQWIAYSAKLGRPDVTPLFGVSANLEYLQTWWRKAP